VNVEGKDEKVKIQVEYQWKPKVCQSCHIFGHNESTCPKMVTKTIWKPKHSQKESHPLAAGNGKEIISNEVEPTTEMVMSKEKPPLDHGCSINSEIGVAILRQPIHRL
ncbi:unnamed protein product, partial [Ilex paraguariensis]